MVSSTKCRFNLWKLEKILEVGKCCTALLNSRKYLSRASRRVHGPDSKYTYICTYLCICFINRACDMVGEINDAGAFEYLQQTRRSIFNDLYF